jgi:hypothetical protein
MQIRHLVETLDLLYDVFAQKRAGDHWSAEVARMQNWLQREERRAACCGKRPRREGDLVTSGEKSPCRIIRGRAGVAAGGSGSGKGLRGHGTRPIGAASNGLPGRDSGR